jgi:hypothetical protein
MSEPMSESEPAYHLYVDPDELPVAASALRLFISDEAHQTEIRGLARGILERLEAHPGGEAVLRVPLSPEEMKIIHSAVRLLLNDLQRGQNAEREILWRILEKLPDEHTMRAIELP